MAQQPTSLTGLQLATKSYARFGDFETMDTQSERHGLPPNRLAWCENMQIQAPNKLVAVLGPRAAINTITGKTVTKMWGVNSSPLNPGFASTASLVCFCTDGSLQYVTGASVTQMFGPGTLSNPDITIWNSPPNLEILIADPAGYATWNSVHGLVTTGGVSPHIVVTAGGSGYVSPTATITGGSGSGATATATQVGGVITAITLTNPGSGYKAGDVLTVNISGAPGTGATATAIVWPFISQFPAAAGITAASIAIFQGRVWLAVGKSLIWSGTKGFDDFNPANASGSTIIADADVVLQVTALRNLNNFLWIFCDQAIKQIGTISVSGSITVFSIVTLSSDIGTTFPQTIQSYNRLVLFTHITGVYAALGSSVEKISDPMQNIFDNAVFTTVPQAFIADINNRHVYGVLVLYNDARTSTTRTLLLIFQRGIWWVGNQGASMTAVGYIIRGDGTISVYGSSGADVTPLFAAAPGGTITIFVQTALTDHGKPQIGKKLLRQATVNFATHAQTPVTFTVDTENGSDSENYNLVAGAAPGFQFVRGKANGTGIYCGCAWGGTVTSGQFILHSAMIEYQDTTALASTVGV